MFNQRKNVWRVLPSLFQEVGEITQLPKCLILRAPIPKTEQHSKHVKQLSTVPRISGIQLDGCPQFLRPSMDHCSLALLRNPESPHNCTNSTLRSVLDTVNSTVTLPYLLQHSLRKTEESSEGPYLLTSDCLSRLSPTPLCMEWSTAHKYTCLYTCAICGTVTILLSHLKRP